MEESKCICANCTSFLPFLCTLTSSASGQANVHLSSFYGSVSESSLQGSPCPLQIHYLNESHFHPTRTSKFTSLSVSEGPGFSVPLHPTHSGHSDSRLIHWLPVQREHWKGPYTYQVITPIKVQRYKPHHQYKRQVHLYGCGTHSPYKHISTHIHIF